MRSIQRRLGLGLGAVLLVVGLVLAQTGLWLFDQGLRRYLAGNLREEAESLLVAMVPRAERHATGRATPQCGL